MASGVLPNALVSPLVGETSIRDPKKRKDRELME